MIVSYKVQEINQSFCTNLMGVKLSNFINWQEVQWIIALLYFLLFNVTICVFLCKVVRVRLSECICRCVFVYMLGLYKCIKIFMRIHVFMLCIYFLYVGAVLCISHVNLSIWSSFVRWIVKLIYLNTRNARLIQISNKLFRFKFDIVIELL